MLFTSVPAVFSSTSSDTSRPGGNSWCFVKGKRKQLLQLVNLLVQHVPLQTPLGAPARRELWGCRRCGGSHLGMEGDLGEEEPRVDAHQLPVAVVQMALMKTQRENWGIWSDAENHLPPTAAPQLPPSPTCPSLHPHPLASRLFLLVGCFPHARDAFWPCHPLQVLGDQPLPKFPPQGSPSTRSQAPSKAPTSDLPSFATYPQVSHLADVAAVPLAVLEDLGAEVGAMEKGSSFGIQPLTAKLKAQPQTPEAGEVSGLGANRELVGGMFGRGHSRWGGRRAGLCAGRGRTSS